MKATNADSKSTLTQSKQAAQESSVAEDGLAIEPPLYGIDFLDRAQETALQPKTSLPKAAASLAPPHLSPGFMSTGQTRIAPDQSIGQIDNHPQALARSGQTRPLPAPTASAVFSSSRPHSVNRPIPPHQLPVLSAAPAAWSGENRVMKPALDQTPAIAKPPEKVSPFALIADRMGEKTPPAPRQTTDFMMAGVASFASRQAEQVSGGEQSGLAAKPEAVAKKPATAKMNADKPATVASGAADVPKRQSAPIPAQSVQPPQTATAVEAGSPPNAQETEAAPKAEGLEALSDHQEARPEEQRTQEKLDAAPDAADSRSQDTEYAADIAPASAVQDTASAGVTEEKDEELPESQSTPPLSAGEYSAAPPPPLEDDQTAIQKMEAMQAKQTARLEQEDSDYSAQQIQENHAEEQAEAQASSPQAESVSSAAEGSADLGAEERAAALASVSEDVGGGEAAAATGGGGGAAAAASVAEPEAPDTAAMTPEQGLAASADLPVGSAVKALGGVNNSIDDNVRQESVQLQDSMPTIEVGSGESASAMPPLKASGNIGKTPRAAPQTAKSLAAPPVLPPPLPSPVRNIPSPHFVATADGSLSAADSQKLQASIQALPSTDSGMNMTAGPAPALKLNADADPAQMTDQKQKLAASIQMQQAQGQSEVAAPAGENDIRVRRPKELLKGNDLMAPAGTSTAMLDSPEQTIAIIAEQKKGEEMRAAISQAQKEVAAKKSEHQNQVAEEKQKSRQQLDDLQQETNSQQNEVRKQARAEVDQARADWRDEQHKEVAKADEQTQLELSKGNEDIGREQRQADEQAAKHIADGEREALRHKRDAESAAERKKQEAEQESSGGVFGWLSSKVTAFFDKLKQGLTSIFDAAKKLIHNAIEQAQKFAFAVIDKARSAIVSIIRSVGNALIAIGDALLAAFPSLKAKWRSFIESKVKTAEEAVNRLADALKRGAQKLLDLLGKGMTALLALYQKGLQTALDAVKSVATGAIKFAKSVAETLGAFASIVKDIAANPGQWLSNLGAAIKDGIKNHLWKALSTTVKQWFNDKLEEVVGIGSAIWSVLKKGGIALKEVGAMVWTALKQAIPSALISLLIEKLVAMIVPAAGAVMVIIEGVRAAWGSIQRIITAISKFVAFLKAVKTGSAGSQFASMLAAAAVVVIDFVSHWLLRKLRKPASKVGGKIKAIAKKIMEKIKAVAKKAGRWVKGKFKGISKKFKALRKKFDRWRDKKGNKKSQQQKKAEKIKRAQTELPSKIKQFLSKKPGRLRLLAQLMIWKFQYQLTSLKIQGSAKQYHIIGKINPTLDLAPGWSFEHSELMAAIDRIAERMLGEANDEKMELADKQDDDAPIDLTKRHEPAKAVAALTPESGFITGETVSGVQIGHSHKQIHAPQPGPKNANWQGIAALGEEGKGHFYGDIGQGLRDQPTGKLLAKILRGEKVPDLSAQQIKLLGEMHGLWFAKEPSHSKQAHRRDLVYGFMVTELMNEGNGGKALTTRQGISLHPASFGGAQAGAKRVSREMKGKSGWAREPKTEKAMERRKKINRAAIKRKGRELGTIKLWFRRHATDLPQLDRPAQISDVETFVENKIREFLRSRS